VVSTFLPTLFNTLFNTLSKLAVLTLTNNNNNSSFKAREVKGAAAYR